MGGGFFDLTGRTAIVTGGASGLGNAIARALAERGAVVVLADRDAAALGAAADALAADGLEARTLAVDVTDRDALTRAVDDLASALGRIDILVNSAGIALLAPVTEVPDEHWDRVIGVNLTGTFAACRAVATHMKRAGYGRIVNIASQAAHVALEDHAAYAASKSGLFGLTRSLARELGPHGVTANTLSPTVVLTDMGREAWAGPRGEAHKAQIPARRFAEPREVAAAALYLVSTEAAMVNGADLRIDGGFTIA
ncbi:GolD/DthD family dehydrogenase [Zhihengliuella halotolerans]|uniref:Short-subunit dehydrogenase n=1 Tax=Zhihengliuella halotolerans TaxID=370736 RepID=A0A4Q8AGS3_9MICC|nr:D-threitol dehydrogenase [Zhihengliuella halotolerans]RZU63580.1 short-subunit dehydrogenase [Zhihengliuella halotolerans]